MSTFLDEGAEYEGVDLNADAMANAYPRARGRIIRDNVTTHAYRRGAYDAILCMEVLEHVIDPIALLIKLEEALVPEGVLISTSALGPGENYEPGNREHLREWNPIGFRIIHERAGLVVAAQHVKAVYGSRFTNCIAARRLRGSTA